MRINFSLGDLSESDLRRRWICHNDGDLIAESFLNGSDMIVTTGFGLSGIPHAGTLSQILRSISLQKAGIPVNMVLGDLDAYNGKAKSLDYTLELVSKYEDFIERLGFVQDDKSNLRSQFNDTDVLRTSYIIGHYMDDGMFNEAEEDLHKFYSSRGRVDSGMSYRRKLSLNLMTADFIHLGLYDNYDSVLVMLGLDEYKYVRFAMETVRRMKEDGKLSNFNLNLGGLVRFNKTIYYDNETNQTIVKLELEPTQNLKDLEYYQKIPKCMAQLADHVDFDELPEDVKFRVIEADPLVAWNFANVKAQKEVNFGFAVDGEISADCLALLEEFFIATKPSNKLIWMGAIAGLFLIAAASFTANNGAAVSKIKDLSHKKRMKKIQRRLNKL